MLRLRKLAPVFAQNCGCIKEISTARFLLKGKGASKDERDDKQEEGFELLPPGCSMVDPAYGLSVGDPVYFADNKPNHEAPSGKSKKGVPRTPSNLAAAEQQLKDKKKIDSKPEDEEPYVYLPPGSSMREPSYNSMSDPVGGRVYYRDPLPVMRKK